MQELLVLVLLMSVVLLVAAVALWAYAASLAGRLSATQGRVLTVERQASRRMDALSGRLRRVEERVAEGGSGVDGATASVVVRPTESGAVDGAASPELQADAEAEVESTPKAEPNPNPSLAAYRRAKDAARAAEGPVAGAAGADREVDAGDALGGGGDAAVRQPIEPGGGEQVGASVADASCADEAVGDGDEVGPSIAEAALAGAGADDGVAGRLSRGALLDFERLLGGKVFVWIGAVALVLTGAFLLKYGFEHDIITEPVRVVAAGVFGLALLGVAEWLRPRAGGRYVQIAQAACGAGVAVLFGTVYAGHALYELIDDVPAFALLCVVTAGAVVLSLRFGPLVALLGLVGGFALPPLLGEALPGRAAMVVYLLALELGVLAVTRKRGWLGISALTLLGSVGWSLGYVALGGTDAERGATALLLMGTAVVFILNTATMHGRAGDDAADTDRAGVLARRFWLALGAVGTAVALLGVLVLRSGYSGQDVVMLGLMSAGVLVLARIDARYTVLGWVSLGLGAVVLLGAGLAEWWAMGPADLAVLWRGSIAFGLLFALGGYAAMAWRPRRETFALMSAVAGPVFLAVAFVGGGWVREYYDGRSAWWPWALGMALGYGLLAWPVVRGWVREVGGSSGETAGEAASAGTVTGTRWGWAASVFAVVCVGLLALAAVFGLNHPWLAVGWALLGAGSAVLGWVLRLRVLSAASAVLAGCSAVLLVVPGPFMVEVGGVVVYNTLLAVYGLAALSYGVCGWAAHRAGWGAMSRAMQGLAVGALAVGCAVLVRHGFHGADFAAEHVRLYEWPTYAVVLMALGLAVAQASRRLGLGAAGFAGTAVGMLGVCLSVVGPVLFGNPLVYGPVATPDGTLAGASGVSLMFGMLYLYALPCVLVMMLAYAYDRIDEVQVARVLRGVAVLLAAVFVVMQVRNGFNLADLHRLRVGYVERSTYGPALFALGFALWSYDWVRGSCFAREAGRVVAAVAMAGSLAAVVVFGNPLVDAGLDGGAGLAWAMVYGMLLPAAAGWWYAALSDPGRGSDAHVGGGIERFLRVGGVVLVACCVGLQVRNGFHADALRVPDVTRYEWATYGLCWVALSALIAGVARLVGWAQDTRRVLMRSALAIGLLGIGTAILGTWLIANPLWTRQSVGSMPVVNGLWYLYGPTILALAVLARVMRHHGRLLWARAAGGGAIALGFGLLSLLVRQGFSGDGVLLLAKGTDDTEWYAYSLAWVVYGIGLLAAGIATRLDTLRFGSLAVMLVAVAKVFALDTAGLQDLLRVFSFLGLGVTLLLLGYTYQRFVFRRPGTEEPPSPTVQVESGAV